MAVIAANCPDVKVTVLDIMAKRIDQWNSGMYSNSLAIMQLALRAHRITSCTAPLQILYPCKIISRHIV